MKRIFLVLLLFAAFFSVMSAQPFLRLPAILGDHMVLQENSKTNIWGWADPNTVVTVTTSWGETVKVKSRFDTAWSVYVRTPESSDVPASITISTDKNVSEKIDDILIGQVWLCSGQSNMNWSASNGILDIRDEQKKKLPENLRLFTVCKRAHRFYEDDVEGEWMVCDSASLEYFSAVAYYFGKNILEGTGYPVGLINSSWGGTPVEMWTPKSAFKERKDILEAWKHTAYSQRSGWDVGYAYNSMIYPLRNMNIAGVIWYQGEANKNNASYYEDMSRIMLHSWRKLFRHEFPFYFVQIAPHFQIDGGVKMAYVREAQEKIWKTEPKTGMVCISDQVDKITDIHPKYKAEVGRRLASMALAEVYGKEGFAYKTPTFKSMEIRKNKAIVSFNDIDEGLVCKGDAVVGLEIAGEDMKFVKASGMVNSGNNTLVIWSDSVRRPVAVRYCFSDYVVGNLFDGAGLPVAPFRTDSVPFEDGKKMEEQYGTRVLDTSKGTGVVVEMKNAEVRPLKTGAGYFLNRKYNLTKVSSKLQGWSFLAQNAAHRGAEKCVVEALEDGAFYVLARYNKTNNYALRGWTIDKTAQVRYATNDPENPGILYVYSRNVKKGERITLPASTDFAGLVVISDNIKLL